VTQQTDRQTDRETDRQTDRETDRETDRQRDGLVLTRLMKVNMWQCTQVVDVGRQQTLVSMSIRLQVQHVLKTFDYLSHRLK